MPLTVPSGLQEHPLHPFDVDTHRPSLAPTLFTQDRTVTMRPWRQPIAILLLAAIAGSASAQVPGPLNAITDVTGISVGHFTGAESGATVVLAASRRAA